MTGERSFGTDLTVAVARGDIIISQSVDATAFNQMQTLFAATDG